MPPSSVPSEPLPPSLPTSGPRILLCGLNWLGDAILSMPAIQALRDHHAQAQITLLTKPSLAPLWAMHATPNRILTLPPAGKSLRPIINEIQNLKFEVSYILPHSFRSVLPPFFARIPKRIGLPGHFPRDFLLTETRPPALGPGRTHQVFEMLDLFFPGENRRTFTSPRLSVSPAVLDRMHTQLSSLPRPWISILPGAARGPSKQWPVDRYAETAATLVARTGGSILALGTPSEQIVCQQVAAAAAPNGLNLAGSTTLEELSAVLALSTVVLCNDSGGMHLAAALGTPLVALFGITNPEQTGPLGKSIRILQRSDHRTRDIPRHSPEAQKALCAISVDEATQAVLSLLHS